jgi:predicted NAD/FAD-binding protein|tara:strand:- start:1249 stop:2496 length:1248 start_codon:yes stop_codon:yes gene_type:complete
MKIAIIGSGISGLTSAYLLNRNHDITVFEANDYIGGHTHTHNIKIKDKEYAVDTGFIVYNERTYPNFIKLLDTLGVERQLSTMGFSVKSASEDYEYAGESLNSLFAKRSNIFRLGFLRMLYEMYRFGKKSDSTGLGLDVSITLGTYLRSENYSNEFINYFIIPMGAAIWSTPANKVLDMPAYFFIKFFYNHGMLEIINRPKWWVIKDGSSAYIKKIIKGFESKINLSSPIRTVSRLDNGIEIETANSKKPLIFDAVVFATHSDQALGMLKDPTEKEKDILSSIPYQKNEVLLHTDSSVLPKRKLAWASWNYQLDSNPESPVVLTYNMNILQSLDCDETFCVTLNDHQSVDKSKVLKKITYHHPLFTVKGIEAQKRKLEISGVNNTYYCGAYWHNGFHEDGVASAIEVCKHFGEQI